MQPGGRRAVPVQRDHDGADVLVWHGTVRHHARVDWPARSAG